MNTMKRREFLKKITVGGAGLLTGLPAFMKSPNVRAESKNLRAQPGLENAVPLPDGVLKGPGRGYITSLNKNIGPELDLISVGDGLYVGKYKHGGKFYPLDGQIEDGRLGCTVKLYGGKSKMDFFIEVDDRGALWYLASESPEKARELAFSPVVAQALFPLCWESANKQHTPRKKLRHHTVALPVHGALLAMNWINGVKDDKRNIPDFWIGVHPVTEYQWNCLMHNKGEGSNRPVDIRDRNRVNAFCNKLTEQERAAGRLPEGYVYRLPTDAEWEYACRAGTTGDVNVDGATLEEVAWFWENSGNHCDDWNHNNDVHLVCQKRPNAWGLYDMLGNAWEYVQEVNVFRGGSFYSYREDCKSSSKTSMGGCPNSRNYRRTYCKGTFLQDKHTLDFLRKDYRFWDNSGRHYACMKHDGTHGHYDQYGHFEHNCRGCCTYLGFRVVLAPVI